MPVPFSTKKGINIVGVTKDHAPVYDPEDPLLKDESEVLALDRACIHEQEFQWEMALSNLQGEDDDDDNDDDDDDESEPETVTETEAVMEPVTKVIDTAAIPKVNVQKPSPPTPTPRTPRFNTVLVPPQVASRFPSRSASTISLNKMSAPDTKTSTSAAGIPRVGTVTAPSETHEHAGFTPNDRGQYLAYSAPGSRIASAQHSRAPSRSASPNSTLKVPGQVPRRSHTPALRPVASTSRLSWLLDEENTHRPYTAALENTRSRHQQQLNQPNTYSDPQDALHLAITPNWIDPAAISAFVESVSRHPSLSSSFLALPHPGSQSHSPLRATADENVHVGTLYLAGTGYPDIQRKREHEHEQQMSIHHNHHHHVPSEFPVFHSSPHAAAPATTGLQHSGALIPRHTDTTTTTTDATVPVSNTSGILQPEGNNSKTLYIPLSNRARPRAASRALNQAYNASKTLFSESGTASNGMLTNTTAAVDSGVHHPHDDANININANINANINQEEGGKGETETEAEAEEAAPRCPLHQGKCDGESVVEQHVTLRVWGTRHFWNQHLPVVECEGGRVLVDWAGLRDEEVERRKKQRAGE